MRRFRILVSRFGPSAPKDLCEALEDLGVLQSHLHKTKYVPDYGDVVINWGCIIWPKLWDKVLGDGGYTGWRILNNPNKVRISTNRIKSLPLLKAAQVNVPEMSTDPAKVAQWQQQGFGVIARAQNRSFGGHGLMYVASNQPLPANQALFTKYQPKKDEYRVHVFNGQVIHVSQKRRRKGMQCDSKIRSWGNGWVFCQSNVHPPKCVLDQAVKAVGVLGLDFAAVDVGYTENIDKATVYECNTAPGLWPSSVAKYAEAIRSAVGA